MADLKYSKRSHQDLGDSYGQEPDPSVYVPVGQRLRNKREWQHQLLSDVSRALKINEKSLQAIEDGDMQKLPALVYARGFVKLYAEHLGLDAEQLVSDFTAETNATRANKEQKITPQQLRSFHRPVIVLTPRLVAIIAGILVALIALSYLFFEVRGFTRPPMLEIISPAANSEIKTDTVEVRGKTDPTAEVKINGEKTFVQSDGTFSEKISVSPGLNKIRIIAKSISEKEKVVEREILVAQGNSAPSSEPSPETTVTPEAGSGTVALVVKSDDVVWISIVVDGKNAFSGSLSPNDEKSFSGKEISVTSGKGNKVQVKKNNEDWKVLAVSPGVVKDIVFK